MSNSRRARRHMRSRHRKTRELLADAAGRYPEMVTEAVAALAEDRLAEGQPQTLPLAGQNTGEAVQVGEAAVVEAPRTDRPGRLQIQLIKAGWSLNGRYYPAEVLRRDGPTVFGAGTHAFVDHATDMEDAERPAGSLKNLAAVMTEPARWDEERQALLAEVRLFAPWRGPITDMWEHIGVSIRAMVLGDHGEAPDGRQGLIVSHLVEGRSVDFVTKAAAGGSILAVLESAGNPHQADEGRNIGAWLESRLHLALTRIGDEMYGDGRLTRAERIALSSALGDALSTFANRVETDAPQLFQRDLHEDPTAPVEQAAAETVAPLPALAEELDHIDKLLGHTDPPASLLAPATTAGTSPTQPTKKEEAPMTGTPDGARAPDQAGGATNTPPAAAPTSSPPANPVGSPAAAPAAESPEAQLAAWERERHYRASAAHVEASEAQVAVIAQERDQLRNRANSLAEALTEAQNLQRRLAAERDRAVAEARQLKANETGRLTVDKMLQAAESGVPENLIGLVAPRVHHAIHGHVPLTEHGEVDMPALEALVTSTIRQERVHAAQLLEAQGVGRVRGLGAEGDPTMQMSTQQFEEQVSGLFGALGLDESTARLATKGR